MNNQQNKNVFEIKNIMLKILQINILIIYRNYLDKLVLFRRIQFGKLKHKYNRFFLHHFLKTFKLFQYFFNSILTK